ncbi:hypothetical protein SAMN05216553_108338 [Lentzea fradiae]|uniref:Uncharacterized protein n=1 Tax=Lentzea fradiae TaxID=200378 RepID=A0A1G7UPH1_9PSEU|nr:hypothetical protein [Lentzea fradiae]SDG49495.1 hypothetical protein SAMN05216553_108338 [Lentzea fradiae]
MKKSSLALSSVLLALTATLVPASAYAAGSSVVVTSEGDCLEFGEITQITTAQARALVPSRYKVREADGTPGKVNVYMGDYSCDGISVNGGRAKPTMITMATVEISHRDGVEQPWGTTQPLWWGTNQPALTDAVQRLGAPARHVQATRKITRLPNGMLLVHNKYSGSKVDHERIAVVEDISSQPVQNFGTPTGYYTGTKGEIEFVYDMQFRAKENAASSILVSGPHTDLVRKYGFPITLTSKNTLMTGKWTMRAELKR